MGERGTQLLDTADRQISDLIGLLSTAGAAALKRPCPGRGRLGDGTVGATASHTVDNYDRVAGFLKTTLEGRSDHGPGSHGAGHMDDNVDLDDLLKRLSAAKGKLALLADLSDEQLEVVPPADDMRFVDGQRTIAQIVTSLLTHQHHQVDAVRAGVARRPHAPRI
jgi:hypothetical protein